MSGGLLLIDDSGPMRRAIGRILGAEPFHIHYEEHGSQVLARARELMPRIIVLDISLPGISGLLLLPLLRKAHGDACIIMLTNHDVDIYRTRALAAGADAYILKSRANEELLPAILAGRRKVWTGMRSANLQVD